MTVSPVGTGGTRSMRPLPTVLFLVSLPCAAGANWPVHNRTTFEHSRFFNYLHFGQEGKVEESKEDPASLNLLIYRSDYAVNLNGGKVKVTLVYSEPYQTPEKSFHSISLNIPAFKGKPPVYQEAVISLFFSLFPEAYAKEVWPIQEKILAVQEEGGTFIKAYPLTNHALLTVNVGTEDVFLNLRL